MDNSNCEATGGTLHNVQGANGPEVVCILPGQEIKNQPAPHAETPQLTPGVAQPNGLAFTGPHEMMPAEIGFGTSAILMGAAMLAWAKRRSA